jgi:hypothetical protein
MVTFQLFKFLTKFEPTAVRDKWFEINDLNLPATGAPKHELIAFNTN